AALGEEDSLDLLEAPPEEAEVGPAAIPAAQVGPPTASPASTSGAQAPTAHSYSEITDTPTPDVFSIGHRQVASRPLAHRGLGSPGRLPPRPRVAAPIPPRWGPLPSAVAAEIIPPASPRRTRKKLS